MTFVLQPERVLLRSQIKAMLRGRSFDFTLDVGGGNGARYRDLINTLRFQSLDINSQLMPDIISSADAIPLGDKSVDLVLSSQMLEHVENPKACLREMNRVLCDDGLLLITVPFINETHSEPYDFWRFTIFGLTLLLEEASFEIVSLEKRGGYRVVKAQFLIRFLIEKFAQDSNNVVSRKLVSFFARIYTPYQIWLDKKFYKSRISSKFTLGYTVLARKVIA